MPGKRSGRPTSPTNSVSPQKTATGSSPLPASVTTIILLVLSYLEISFILIFTVILILSIAMISNIRFPKPDLKINAIASILIILSIITGKEFYGFAPILLVIEIFLYSIVGPIYKRFSLKK